MAVCQVGIGAVRKTFRDERELAAQVEALRAFGEARAVRVIDVRRDERTALLERVEPGATLASTASEDEAMQVVAQLFARRWPGIPADAVATAIGEFASALDRGGLARPGVLFAELLADSSPPVLLHGDLHYDNILTSDRAGHLLIDPKGFTGDPAFDIGYLVSRPMPAARDRLPLSQAIDRRLAFLPGATGLDAKRVTAFAYVAAALSVAWAREDRDPAADRFVESMRVLEGYLSLRG
jgi:streptomycin 6-kinase